MDSIKGYLDKRFSRMPDTPQVQRAKQELGQMMEDKYSELIHEGKSHEDAMDQVIAEFGNLDELAQDLGIEGDMSGEGQSMRGRDYDQPGQESGQSGQDYGRPEQESGASGLSYGQSGGTPPYGTSQTFTPPKKDSTAGHTALIVTLSVIGGFVLVGLIIAGLVIGGIWGFFKIRDKDLTHSVISEVEQVTDSMPLDFFTEADLDLAVANLVIEVGDDYRIRYDGAKNLEPECKVEQGKLTIRQPDAGDVSLFQNRRGIDITVTIPKDAQIKDFKVDLDLGNIEWGESPINVTTVDITADLGNVKFSDCGMDTGIFQCSAGNVELKNCSANSLTVECNLGDMSITDCLGQKVDVDCDMGNVSMENVAFDDYEVSCDMGKVEISSVFDLRDYKIDISTDLGSVEVNGKSQGTKFSQDGTKGSMEVDADMGSVVLKYSDIPKKE